MILKKTLQGGQSKLISLATVNTLAKELGQSCTEFEHQRLKRWKEKACTKV